MANFIQKCKKREANENSLKSSQKIVGKITQDTQKVEMCILIVDMNCLSLRLFIYDKLNMINI